MTDAQTIMTLHMYHSIVEIVQNLLKDNGICVDTGIEKVYDYAMRFEFQGRGTLHVHVVAHAHSLGAAGVATRSPLVRAATTVPDRGPEKGSSAFTGRLFTIKLINSQ